MHCIARMLNHTVKLINQIIPQNKENQSFEVEGPYRVDPSLDLPLFSVVVDQICQTVSCKVMSRVVFIFARVSHIVPQLFSLPLNSCVLITNFAMTQT